MTRYVQHRRREERLLVSSVGTAVARGSSYATEKTLQSHPCFREGRRDLVHLGNSRLICYAVVSAASIDAVGACEMR